MSSVLISVISVISVLLQRVFIRTIGMLCWGMFLLPAVGFAQFTDFSLSGYAKYLCSFTESSFSDERLTDHLLHVRLNTRWYPTSWLTAAVDVRVRGFYGDSVRQIPNFRDQIQAAYEHTDLDAELWDGQDTYGYAEIDRVFLDAMFDNWQMTLGRQRVAWGTSLVWNAIDLFNPMSILDFDYEERPGADAVRLQYFTGPVSRIEAVVKPGKNQDRQTVAGLWSVNAGGYDFFLLAAQQHHRKLIGGAWAGYVKGGGFRGEITISEPPSEGAATRYPTDGAFGSDLTSGDNTAVSIVVSGDYTFPNTLYLHAEALFNNTGKTEYAGVFWPQIGEAGLLSPARWSLYQEVAYDVHPLVRGSVFMFWNPHDRSFLAAPSLTWNISANLDLMTIAFLPSGDQFTEFGDMGQAIYVRLKYAF